MNIEKFLPDLQNYIQTVRQTIKKLRRERIPQYHPERKIRRKTEDMIRPLMKHSTELQRQTEDMTKNF